MARTPVQRIDPDLQRLFAGVLASPDDDTPRLVLADALMERGDPRGELIAIQCARSEADDAVDRVAALLHEHEDRWTEGLGPKTLSYGFQRGFVEEVRGPSEVLSRYLPKLARVTPIRRVVVTKLDDPSVEALVSALVQTGVRSLTLNIGATAQLVRVFANSALPTVLEELRLTYDSDAMLACALPRLRRLALKASYLTPTPYLSLRAPIEHLEYTNGGDWLRELSRSTLRDTLRTLSLERAQLGALANLQLPALESVDVERLEFLDEKSVRAFEQAPAPLRRLSVQGEAHGPLLQRLLATLSRVESLDLSNCKGAHVVSSADLPRLTELFVRATDVDVDDLLESPHRARLRLLDLESVEVGDEGAIAIAEKGLPELRVLDLRDAGVGAAGAAALAGSAALPLLRDLDLSENPIGEQGALALANGGGLQRISRLALHDVRVGVVAGRALKARFGGALEK